MPTAYSYVRFSTPEQMKGDSPRRQTKLSEEFARANGLTLDKRTYHDLGVSGSVEKNAKRGRCGPSWTPWRRGESPEAPGFWWSP